VNAIVCRPCATYGRGRYDGSIPDEPELERTVRDALIRDPGAQFTVDVPPGERAYVKDVALGIREAIFVEKPSTRVYNLGSGEIVTSDRLAAALNRAIPGLRAAGANPAEMPTPLLDCTLAQQELSYNPSWSLDSAVQDYVNEIRSFAS
jgi:nucleoside-diphosphate-sugar epimerase